MSETQLILDLPHRSAVGAEDFLVSDCNLLAVKTIDAWPDWPQRVQLLLGPEASGKSHLAKVWQARSGAIGLRPSQFDLASLQAAPEGAGFVIEDVDRQNWGESALFHLINLAAERQLSLLLTARKSPALWGVMLPDLSSRLNALAPIEIGPPDDMLLKTVMLKHFSDRQLDVDPKVLDFMALRVERSLAAAAAAVAAVDRAALGSGRKISRQLVAEALRQVSLAE